MHTTVLLNTFWEFTRVEEDKDGFIQKALKVFKTFQIECLKTPRLDVPAKKTAYNLFYKNIRETNEELKSVTISKASAIISKEWKKVKTSDKMKKYKDLFEVEKQRYEEALQRYQEDHLDEVEIISLHKRCNKTKRKTDAKANTKTGSKAESKRGAKTGAKTASKAPRSEYHLFLRKQLEKMIAEDWKNYRSIVSRMWKKIKEHPARLLTYNNRVWQMRDEADKPAKVGDDLSVGSMEQQAVTERSVIKKCHRDSPKKHQSLQGLLKQNQMIQTIIAKKKKLW